MSAPMGRLRANEVRAIVNAIGDNYFWNYEYRHYLRGAPLAARKRVIRALLNNGLALDGESPAHEEIIRTLTEGK